MKAQTRFICLQKKPKYKRFKPGWKVHSLFSFSISMGFPLSMTQYSFDKTEKKSISARA